MTNLSNLPNAFDTLDEITSGLDNDKTGLYNLFYKISKKIFDFRINHKWSQKKLAEKLEVSQVMVSKLESGEYNPTIEQLWKISIKLGWELTINIGAAAESKYVLPNNVKADYTQTTLQSYNFEGNDSFGYSKRYNAEKPVIMIVAC